VVSIDVESSFSVLQSSETFAAGAVAVAVTNDYAYLLLVAHLDSLIHSMGTVCSRREL